MQFIQLRFFLILFVFLISCKIKRSKYIFPQPLMPRLILYEEGFFVKPLNKHLHLEQLVEKRTHQLNEEKEKLEESEMKFRSLSKASFEPELLFTVKAKSWK